MGDRDIEFLMRHICINVWNLIRVDRYIAFFLWDLQMYEMQFIMVDRDIAFLVRYKSTTSL